MHLRNVFVPFRRATVLVMALSSGLAASAICAAEGLEPTPAPEGAMVYLIEPVDGATVESPVHVSFGLRGMGVAPAGTDAPMTGHHHLLIDVDELPAPGLPIPADAQHVHFGKGQTETSIELAPGPHTLRLLLGDFRHIPHAPPVVSVPVHIVVAAKPDTSAE